METINNSSFILSALRRMKIALAEQTYRGRTTTFYAKDCNGPWFLDRECTRPVNEKYVSKGSGGLFFLLLLAAAAVTCIFCVFKLI